MILTVTPNPSLDRTVELPDALAPGAVQRALRVTAEPGGKGVNISRAVRAADRVSLAVLPGDAHDPVLTGLTEAGVAHRALPLQEPLRTNITITDPQGVTTKINEPGPRFDADRTRALVDLTVACAEGAQWAALAGSLPPGMPEDLYAQLIAALRRRLGAAAPKIALDSSGRALSAAVGAGPELIKPNAEELIELVGHLTGSTPDVLPETLEQDAGLVLQLVRTTQRHGVRAALVTLGAHGALLVPDPLEEAHDAPQPQVLRATGPALVARSTVGAGDASLAGFLLADEAGAAPAQALRRAAAQGRAAASLPGSVMPGPDDLDLEAVRVEPLTAEPGDRPEGRTPGTDQTPHPRPSDEGNVRTP